MALNTSLPLRKSDGSLPRQLDLVRVSRVRFRYTGPQDTFYVCWGLKDGGGSFNQGANLLGGSQNFAAQSFLVPQTSTVKLYSIDLPFSTAPQSQLSLSNNVPNVKYDTYIWLARKASALDADRISLTDSSGNVDTDSGVIQATESVFQDGPALPPPGSTTGMIVVNALTATFPPSKGFAVKRWLLQRWDQSSGQWVQSFRGWASIFSAHTFEDVPLKGVFLNVWLLFENDSVLSLSQARSLPNDIFGPFDFVDRQVRTMNLNDGSLS